MVRLYIRKECKGYPLNPSTRQDMDTIKISRLEWIKLSLKRAIDRLPDHWANPSRWELIKKLDEEIKRLKR